MVDWGDVFQMVVGEIAFQRLIREIERMGREIAFQSNFACLASSPSGEDGDINKYFLDSTYGASICTIRSHD